MVQLAVDAAVTGDRQLALQALLLDPVITDLDVARQILTTTWKHIAATCRSSGLKRHSSATDEHR
ncbi:MAG: hypothetical protein R2851_03345 [Caldilineaceae bacterium]